MKAIHFFESFGNYPPATQHHIPEDWSLQFSLYFVLLYNLVQIDLLQLCHSLTHVHDLLYLQLHTRVSIHSTCF